MARIEYLLPDKIMNKTIAGLPGVQARVHAQAFTIGVNAERRLMSHRKSGKHRITVSEGDIDAFVNLEGPGALSLEFGHWVSGSYERKDPKWVNGIFVLTGAMGVKHNAKNVYPRPAKRSKKTSHYRN